MKILNSIFYFFMCAIILCACNGKKSTIAKTKSEVDLERIDNFSVNVTEDCIQIYENSDCRATTAKIDGKDYMIAYSLPLHSIDLIALDGSPFFLQIKLKKEGPDGVNGISGIFYYDNTFVLRTAAGFCRVDKEGKVTSKWDLNDYLSKNEGFGLRFPEQMMVFNLFKTLGFDEKEGLVTQPIYQYEKINGQYPTRILILSCKDWQIVEEFNVYYPENLKHEKWLGCLGQIQALPHGDKVIYNFPSSSDIFVYDRKSKTTKLHSIATKYSESYFHCEDEQDQGLGGGYFMPVYYDYRHQLFWRVQQRKTEGGGLAGKSFSVVQLTLDFELIGEYNIPENRNISSFTILFTDDKIFFAYLGGEYISENNIAFYGLKLSQSK